VCPGHGCPFLVVAVGRLILVRRAVRAMTKVMARRDDAAASATPTAEAGRAPWSQARGFKAYMVSYAAVSGCVRHLSERGPKSTVS